ncbi:2-oxoglutarate dehydrogenase E1 component, partial [hydrothermal vent metagenome]
MTRKEENSAFLATSFLYGGNATYVEELYSQFKEDPNSVDGTWADFFNSLGDAPGDAIAAANGASWGRADWPKAASGEMVAAFDGDWGNLAEKSGTKAITKAKADDKTINMEQVAQASRDSIRAAMMIRAYRIRGHLHADLDPLKLQEKADAPELDPRSYGFAEADFSRPIFIDNMLGLEYASISQMVEILQRTYCSTLGVEFMYISDPVA